MKIIIVGAGTIGRSLARSLSEENHEIYLIESDEISARRANDKLDVKVVRGNGADPDVLQSVYVEHADLVIAVTTSDETNLVVCSVAAALGAKRRIARVRNTALSAVLNEYGFAYFHINDTINPEVVAAQAIIQTVRTPGASEVSDFAEGRILLRAFDIPATSPMCGARIQDISDEDFPWPFLVIAIARDHDVVIPKGDTVIQANDHIYVLIPAASLAEFLSFINPNIKMPTKVIIFGASIMGEYVARAITDKVRDVILIEEDPEKASAVAGRLSTVTVLNGSGAEADLLSESGIEAADMFIATTGNDHSNLVSAVLAKKMGAKSTLITTQQPDYMYIVDALNIDSIINPHFLAIEQILKLVRGKGINAITKIMECRAEAVEFIAEEDSQITKRPLKEMKFPKDCIVGAISSQEDVSLANGNSVIKAGDKAIVFCHESAVKKLQALFTKKGFI